MTRTITISDVPLTPEWHRLVEALALPAVCFLAASLVALWAIRTSSG